MNNKSHLVISRPKEDPIGVERQREDSPTHQIVYLLSSWDIKNLHLSFPISNLSSD